MKATLITIADEWNWTPTCSACQTGVLPIVQVGERFEHDSMTAYLCEGCVREAVALFDSAAISSEATA
jgi:hypothetical protein